MKSNVSRVPGTDLLRIVTMLMILTSHFFVHGGILGKLKPGEPYFYICWIIEAFCYVMVNCYALITGYFQSRTEFRLKKLLLLWGQILFLSAGIYLVLAWTGQISFDFADFSNAALPVTMQRYWFVTAYMILYALSPLLNFTIQRMNRRQHALCLAVLCGIFVVFRNFFYWSDFANLHGGYSWASLAVLYMIGAYLRLYPPKLRHPLLWYGILSLITGGSRILLTTLYYRYGFDSVYLKALMQYNSVTVVAASVCLFLFFVRLDIQNRVLLWFIRFFAPAVFGVYLIHEQVELKEILWDAIAPAQYLHSPRLLPYLLLVVVVLFVTCALLDKLRHLLSVVLHLPQLVEAASDKISAGCRKLFNRLVPEEHEKG
ncbi:MAG: acyltransferase [Eubacteriales bacterium]